MLRAAEACIPFGMNRATYLLGAAICLAAGLGCGGSGTTEPPAATGAGSAPGKTTGGTADACGLLPQSDVAESVGNQVKTGAAFAGPEVCKWDVDTQGDVTVLLTVRLPGSIREQTLCPDIRKSGKAAGFEALADGSTWKFESVMGLFSSGDFESCGPKGYVGLMLNGKRDEAKLKQATAALLSKVLARL